MAKCAVYYETAILEHIAIGIKHIEFYSFTKRHLKYTKNPFQL